MEEELLHEPSDPIVDPENREYFRNALEKFLADRRPWDEELRSWLEIYLLENPQYDTNILSRSYHIGLPRQVLDLYLSGEYFLPVSRGGKGFASENSRVEEEIRAFRQRVGGSESQRENSDFYETETWRQIKNACRIAIDEKTIVFLSGNPGIGKTLCLREFAQREMRVPPISILCSRNITSFNFVEQIAAYLHVTDRRTIPDFENEIALKLQRSPRALFVDQADFLGSRSFGSIIHFWEKASIPVIICGTLGLIKIFNDPKISSDLREQLASRVGYYLELSGLELAEAKTIIKRSLEEETNSTVIARIYELTRYSYRRLNVLLARINNLKQKNEAELASGEIEIRDLVDVAASKLIAF